MEYQVKPKDETLWGGLCAAVATLTAAILISQFGVDTTVAIPAGAVTGALVRPVGGYLISFLPKEKPSA